MLFVDDNRVIDDIGIERNCRQCNNLESLERKLVQ